ncbi:MAG: cupin domain-containing protein [Chloroflexota bacterium]|nr:cupin domain-containing protein [Chloroflexota bacterium]
MKNHHSPFSQETILSADPQAEHFTEERCFILELASSPADEALSLARARVERGVTTALHRLNGVAERYVILEGQGCVEVGSLPPRDVSPGDVVLIPPGVSQRISNTGAGELVFLCICTPPFRPECYEDLE